MFLVFYSNIYSDLSLVFSYCSGLILAVPMSRTLSPGSSWRSFSSSFRSHIMFSFPREAFLGTLNNVALPFSIATHPVNLLNFNLWPSGYLLLSTILGLIMPSFADQLEFSRQITMLFFQERYFYFTIHEYYCFPCFITLMIGELER